MGVRPRGSADPFSVRPLTDVQGVRQAGADRLRLPSFPLLLLAPLVRQVQTLGLLHLVPLRGQPGLLVTQLAGRQFLETRPVHAHSIPDFPCGFQTALQALHRALLLL